MYKITENTIVGRGPTGKVRSIEHIREPFMPGRPGPISPMDLADDYVKGVSSIYAFDGQLLDNLSAPIPGVSTNIGSRLHRVKVKNIAGSVVADYAQSFAGLPVWGADFAVHLAASPLRVTSSNSSLHDAIKLGNDRAAVAAAKERAPLTPTALSQLLALEGGLAVSKINGTKLVIYQYEPKERLELPEPGTRNVSFEQGPPMPKLPPVPPSFEAGTHYAVLEVLFDLTPPGWHDLHWRAMIDPISGAVLYLRALVAFATAMVFPMDPISQSGNTALIPSATEAALSPFRLGVPLSELNLTSPQPLSGTQVEVRNIELPADAPPSTTTPFAFDYSVKTVNFAATNAYYHVNWFFNLIRSMGFTLGSYFDGTTFPVGVDHWSLGGTTNVNAHCQGNTTGSGIGHFCFAAAQAGETVGIADDIRVVIHEFGHALLWDHVNSPNFGFAHSAGDALGAILMDPASVAPDRFLSFPWPQGSTGPLDRRHDRQVSAGWGWFGSHYNTQYNGEQVLSTTLFRLYRSVGGDSPYLADRQWAARYVSYLIIKAIGLLTTTTNDPEVFVTALMNADLTTASFEGHPGGALHKVIRWAFEKQGLYGVNAHPGTTTPVTTVGAPPPVDVYINDGRNGEYDYLFSFWESPDMWVRRAPDGGTTHQEPIIGAVNYMYVRVKNRGTAVANNVSVKAYQCDPGAGLTWPEHWGPMDTPILMAGAIPSGGSVVVGPFAWTPHHVGHECLLAIASSVGDAGNDTTVMGSIPHSRFVPFDNNIGQRNVCPIILIKKEDLKQKLRFRVVNPLPNRTKVQFSVQLPKVLRDNEYWAFFSNEGAHQFELAPNESRTVEFSIVNKPRIPNRHPWKLPEVLNKPGIARLEDTLDDEGFNSVDDLGVIDKPLKVRVMVLMDGQSMGGMTYEIRKGETRIPPLREPVVRERPNLGRIIEAVSGQPGVSGARVRRVTLDVDVDDGDDKGNNGNNE